MTVMAIVGIMLACGAGGLFCFIAAAETCSNTAGFTGVFLELVFVGMIGWLVAGSYTEWRYSEPTETEITLAGGIATIAHNGTLYNLNEMISRQFEEGAKVKVYEKETGPYLGIYYGTSEGVHLPKIEVLE
jgi:hypothetical protein